MSLSVKVRLKRMWANPITTDEQRQEIATFVATTINRGPVEGFPLLIDPSFDGDPQYQLTEETAAGKWIVKFDDSMTFTIDHEPTDNRAEEALATWIAHCFDGEVITK